MTELDIIRHAKDYLDKLANGIDPLTGQTVPEDDVVRKARISRCLSYVSDVLRQVLENGGIQVQPVKNSEKAPFSLPVEARARYPFGDWPATASVIAQRLNELTDQSAMQKLKTTSITRFLLQAGLLFEEVSHSGSRNKRPTEAGWKLGISTAQRAGQNGEYTAVVYDRRRSGSSWTISTRSSPSTPSPCTKTRESPGRRRRTRICVSRFHQVLKSGRCPTPSCAPARAYGPGWKS